MAYSSLYDERPTMAAHTSEPKWAFFAWIGALRAKHAQRVALSNLLDFDAALLDDLGVDRQDVIEALRSHPHRNAGRTLAARRSSRANDWLTHP